MASSEIGKELMEDSLKHIDELFRSQLGSADVTPPAGVFEQCVQQLQSLGTDGQGLNQGASQQSVQSGLGNVVGSAGKTIFGFSAKASLAIFTSAVVAVIVVSAIVQNNVSVNAVKDANVDLPLNKGLDKNVNASAAGIKNNSDNSGALSATTNAKIDNNSSVVHRMSNVTTSVKSNDVSGDLRASGVLNEINGAKRITDGGKNAGGFKSASGIENSLGVPREKSINEIPVKGPADNSNYSNPFQNRRPLEIVNANPCQKNANQWKPVIADIVGGIVSLGIEGKYDKMRVDWADGERSEVLTDQVGVERVSHQYWVGHNRTFNVKMLNERRVFDEKGMSILCKDSQRVAVNISPTNDATDIFVPDIFTPNGDGLNEEFYIGMAQPQMFDMCVFDLNNRLIFRSDKYDAKWKGVCGSSLCPEGAYRVVISYKYSGDRALKYARKTVKLIYNTNP
ncbi:MAG: hypothetical protein EBQ97_02340 [Bacteroidetes bacterium]|nr:hypothetical protein [Bacteroidota bacterium]